MRLFLFLLPWLELFTLIELGVQTSALTAIFYVLVMVALGLFVIRSQWQQMFSRLQENNGVVSLGPQMLMDDVATSFAGLLLIVPGMITDVMALILLIGPLRRRLARMLGSPARQSDQRFGARDPFAQDGEQPRQPQTIEGSFSRVDDENKS